MFFTHKNFSLSFTMYKSLCFVAVRAIEPSGRLTVARYLINVTVYPLFVTFDTDKKLFRKSDTHNVSFTGFFSFLFNLTFTKANFTTTDWFYGMFCGCVHCWLFIFVKNRERFPFITHMFVAPVSIIHVLVLFISFALQAIAIITSSVLFDSFCFGLNLQKRLMCSFLSQLKHLPLNLFTIVFVLFWLLFTSIWFQTVFGW